MFIDIEKRDNDAVIKVLKEKGVDAYDHYKRTALINAVIHNNKELIKWCLKNGADINVQDAQGMSALHFAAQDGLEYIAAFLIKEGIDLNLKDIYGKDALLTALLNWHGGKNESPD